MKSTITTKEYVNAYNAAVEQVMETWQGAFDECGGFDEWAGDVLDDFLDEFLIALGIQTINED